MRRTDKSSRDEVLRAGVEAFLGEYPWLDRSMLEAQLSFAQAHAVLFSTLSRKYAELGISVPRFNALRLLHHSPERRLTITDLGLRLGVSTASVTRLVDGLIRDGWVRRLNGDTDKRVTHVQLLDAGEARLATLIPQVLAIWSEVWSNLTPEERRAFTRLNAKLRAGLLARHAPEEELGLREY